MKNEIEIDGFKHLTYQSETYEIPEIEQRVKSFYEWANSRRTVRDIGSKHVSKNVIEQIIQTAATAPSGAHKQPWTFCAVSNAEIKLKIREAAEKEEYESYHGRMSERWKNDLKPIATNWNKPFLTEAPWLIVVFKKIYDLESGNEKHNNYYVNESVGIACGFLIAAIHHAGLVTVTHTPSPMNFLTQILKRPENERPYLLLPVGYPKKDALVPDLKRKSLSEISIFME